MGRRAKTKESLFGLLFQGKQLEMLPCKSGPPGLLREGLTGTVFLLWGSGVPVHRVPSWLWWPEALYSVPGRVQPGWWCRPGSEQSLPCLGCIRGHRLIYFLFLHLRVQP